MVKSQLLDLLARMRLLLNMRGGLVSLESLSRYIEMVMVVTQCAQGAQLLKHLEQLDQLVPGPVAGPVGCFQGPCRPAP